MRSVTRKAAITAGLGAAMAAGAAGSASAMPVTDLVDGLAPAAATAQAALPDAAAPFPLSQVTDKLPVGEVLTPGHTAGTMARSMEQGMSGFAAQDGQAKGGLGSPLNALPTDTLPTGESSPLGDLPLGGLSL
ncbi:hypothetical protein OG948_22895 [Embleya sp. NBC_00888]|uniref:hypothetical protein n=1 Tax=Embleya sp. NBC_00888 TaxID=2975960 RepID=UPI003862E396|nr:hypothetical protein OG948_22895 [Embleya sp. NBC_00888]